jgi:acyl carrier protein
MFITFRKFPVASLRELELNLRRSEKMGEKETFEKMINILKPYTKNPELLEKATKDTHILDDLQVNSARLVDVIIACEDTFGIEIDDDEVDEIRTIGDAVKIIDNKLA